MGGYSSNRDGPTLRSQSTGEAQPTHRPAKVLEARHVGGAPGGAGEAYGICAMPDGEGVRIASVLKEGLIVEQRVSFMRDGTIAPVGTSFPDRRLATQTEGCVYDPADGTLYVGEEDVGIWRFARNSVEGTLVAPIDNQQLVADVEGLALLRESGRAWLVASSQGDNAYAVFRLPGVDYVGRFAVTAGKYGATSETDGVEAVAGHLGAAYPDGIFLAQDGDNAPKAQNFKLVRWDQIAAALGL